jgi:hypothetical protein
MDAFTLLKQDHDKVKKMFKDYEELGDRAMKSKQDLATEIFMELAVHEQIEEEIFYPELQRRFDEKEDQEIVLEGFAEHHVADLIQEELKAMTPEDEMFDAKMKVLQENIEHHIEEEETEMFPEAKKALGEDAVPIGEAMMARKEELMQQVAAR